MAKALSKQLPSSSVARLIDPTVGAKAVGPAEPTPWPAPEMNPVASSGQLALKPNGRPGVPQGPLVSPTGELANIRRQLVFTESTSNELDELVRVFSCATGSKLTDSHFQRAVMKALRHARAQLEREAEALGRLARPSNAKGNEHLRDAYEDRIASAIVMAMRGVAEWHS